MWSPESRRCQGGRWGGCVFLFGFRAAYPIIIALWKFSQQDMTSTDVIYPVNLFNLWSLPDRLFNQPAFEGFFPKGWIFVRWRFMIAQQNIQARPVGAEENNFSAGSYCNLPFRLR